MDWSVEKSIHLYGINNWGHGYFNINTQGRVEVLNSKSLPGLDLFNLIQDLKARGIRLPTLLRFSNIIKSRIELLNKCFQEAIKEENYSGKYFGVYPIKVNQQSHLVQEIVHFGKIYCMGLECGSKPELLVTLAMNTAPDALIICNGFKDLEYIETALLAQKIGKNVFIVIDRYEELSLLLQAIKHIDVKPKIGFRLKLNIQGAGRWIESCGEHSKFGLTPLEIVQGVEDLKTENRLECLELLHFHIGSQIPSIQCIKSAIKEASRFYTELRCLGANLKYLDVGGGLGINYDGSKQSHSSCNYTEQEYANDVISIVKSICDEKKIPVPHIVSESGRALMAHSSILVFDVLGVNKTWQDQLSTQPHEDDVSIVKDFFEIYENVTEENLNEFYNDLVEKRTDILNLFSYGALSLKQRAKAEEIYWATCKKMSQLAKRTKEQEDLYWALQKECSYVYYGNFSVFQSLPDSWATKQVFPVMPLQRLKEKPLQKAILADLTCDSDGKVNRFIDTDTYEIQNFIEVHKLKKDEDYFVGVFLTGAYQETLGDLHNLFGDTNAVHITIKPDGNYSVDHVVRGDSVSKLLSYLSYNRTDLIEHIRKATEDGIARGSLKHSEAKQLLNHYEQTLYNYTYLEKEERLKL